MRYYTYPCWRAYFLETTPNTLLFLPYLLVQEITINKGDEVYYMPSTNSAIQICRGCREKAAKQVGGKNIRRPVIPKGHVLNKFSVTGDPWWLKEEHKPKWGTEYLHGCLACKKQIKLLQKVSKKAK